MGKLIGQGGRTVTSEYSELAAEDTERYAVLQRRTGTKMRSEALKPPAAFPAGMRPEMGGGKGPG
jgi:hypothetical protein